MNRRRIAVVFAVFLALSTTAAADPDLEKRLQLVLDRFIAEHPQIPGVMAAVESSTLDIEWRGSAGVADVESGEKIAPDQPVRLASITKTYIAAATLRLMELGRLSLDDDIARHITKRQRAILTKDGYHPEDIEIRHLLTHTSGLADYAMTDEFFAAVTTDPHHRWTRDEQLQFGMDHRDPLGAPGEQYKYSDTGYILLGEIIEQRSGEKLAPALRKLLKFDEIGLEATWLESLEPAPTTAAPRATQYFGEHNTVDWDPSLDLYGGGGLVASMPDLARFYRALFEGQIFDSPDTLATMRTSIVPDYGGSSFTKQGYGSYQYCHGLYVTVHRDYSVFGHGGFWGTRGGYIPALDLSFAVAVTQQESVAERQALLEEILDAVIDGQ